MYASTLDGAACKVRQRCLLCVFSYSDIMTASRRLILFGAVATVSAMVVFVVCGTRAPAAEILLAPGVSHRLSRYVDRNYQFSFWYPRGTTIKVEPRP